MRTIASHDGAFQPGDWLSSLGRIVRDRYSDWADQRRATATAQALYYATDMELRDMGLSRCDIPAIVSRTCRRD
jgi:uncharacterized protein YjiS (DUF1127 family)